MSVRGHFACDYGTAMINEEVRYSKPSGNVVLQSVSSNVAVLPCYGATGTTDRKVTRRAKRMRRALSTLGATAAIACGSVLAMAFHAPAVAQAPRTAPRTAEMPVAATDAPARVGRLARISGVVSFHPDGAERWEPAMLNYPVSDGAAFWTEPGAQADIDLAASRMVMDASTELDINSMDSLAMNATLPQGHVYVRLRDLVPGESLTIQTPRGSVLIGVDGRYGIFAGDLDNPTRVTVLEGAARISGPNVNLELAAGQTGLIEGTDDFAARLAPTQDDPFLVAQSQRDQPIAPPSLAALPQAVAPPQNPRQPAAPPRAATPPIQAPTAVAAMPGGGELGTHGTWAETREYGRVWYPPAATGWRPYRDGNWVWLRRGGWTWVDRAPWGFAPTHYGRWIQHQGRWAWWPGATLRPVYTPALFAVGPGPHGGRGLSMTGGEARRLNIVLPPPRDIAPVRPAAPGPILFRPLPGQGKPSIAIPARPRPR